MISPPPELATFLSFSLPDSLAGFLGEKNPNHLCNPWLSSDGFNFSSVFPSILSLCESILLSVAASSPSSSPSSVSPSVSGCS